LSCRRKLKKSVFPILPKGSESKERTDVMAGTEAKANQTQNAPAPENSSSQQVARRSPSGGLAHRGFDPFFLSPREFFSANPFTLMRRMTEEMDRVFGEFGFGQGQARGGTAWAPAIEVAEREGNYLVHAELPGFKPEDVKVEVTDDALVVQGERKWEQEEKQGGSNAANAAMGSFIARFPYPKASTRSKCERSFKTECSK
jgi:HSP20 family protein